MNVTSTELLNQLTPNTVYILRGLPGSGKSTLAHCIKRQVKELDTSCGEKAKVFIASADNYWIQEDGSYKFDANLVPQNHHWCLRNFITACTLKDTAIILDNTNTSVVEFSHYVKIAQAYNYKVVIVNIVCSTQTSINRNTHDVPEKTIKNMKERFDYCSVNSLEAFAKKHDITVFTINTEP